jgi:hypothetical protein
MENDSPLGWDVSIEGVRTVTETYEDNITCGCHQHRCQHDQGELNDIEIFVVYILG